MPHPRTGIESFESESEHVNLNNIGQLPQYNIDGQFL